MILEAYIQLCSLDVTNKIWIVKEITRFGDLRVEN